MFGGNVMRKISTRVIIIYLLLVIVLVSSSISSFYATNTQEQHIILTEIMGEVKNKVDQVSITSEFFAKVIAFDDVDLSSYEEELKVLDQLIIDVDNSLEDLSNLQYILEDGTEYKLEFQADFNTLFADAVNMSQDSFVLVKSNIDSFIKMKDSKVTEYEAFSQKVKAVNQEMEEALLHVVVVCRDAADFQKKLSDGVQLITMGVAVVVFLIIIIEVQKNIYKPIMLIKDTFSKLSKGNLSQRFSRKKQDEFKEIFDGFNYFLNSLNQIFEIEDSIIKESELEELLSIITIRLKEFLDFSSFGFVYTNYKGKTIKLGLSDDGLIYKTDNLEQKYYEEICQDDDQLIVPIKLGTVNLGYYYFDKYQPKVDNSNFVELIGDKLTIAFYKNILVKDLLSIVTEALADATEARDPETANHLIRMSNYATIIAKGLYEKGKYKDIINSTFIENILITAPMHDIGKIAIEDRILLKPGRFSDEEFEIMKTHAEKGGIILDNLHEKFSYYGITYFKMASEIAYGHQEKYNGTGYPKGRSGDEIPLVARIVMVADVFDALTSKRPYKEAFSLEQSYKIIEESKGTHFDPEMVDIFFEMQSDIEKVYHEFKEI